MKKSIVTTTSCFLMLTSLTVAHATSQNENPVLKKDITYKDTATKEIEQKSWIDNLTGSLSFASDYVFRGISQTENLPAVQGGLTYTFPYGIYLNLWGSNVKFTGTDATVELDTVAGIGGEIMEDLTFDLNAARYNYPRARELNYNEFNTLFNYKFLQFAFSYSANVYNTHQTGTYYNGGINYDIPSNYALGFENLNFLATLGHYSLPRAAGNSYNDYLIALSKTFKAYTFTLQWTDTNGRQNNPPYDSSILAAIISAEF